MTDAIRQQRDGRLCSKAVLSLSPRVTKSQNNDIKMGDHKRSKFRRQTIKFIRSVMVGWVGRLKQRIRQATFIGVIVKRVG